MPARWWAASGRAMPMPMKASAIAWSAAPARPTTIALPSAADQLLTAASFDYERKNSYSIRLRSTDSGGLFYENSFTITVTDGNDAPSDLTLSNASIAENQPSGTLIGTLSWHRSGCRGNPSATPWWLVQRIMAASPSAAMSCSVPSPSILRYATATACWCGVTDAGGLSLEKSFAITITNVNEAPLRHPTLQQQCSGGSADRDGGGVLLYCHFTMAERASAMPW